MCKKSLALLLAVLCLVSGALPVRAAEPLRPAPGRFALPAFDVPCRSAVLIDQDSGTVLYEKQPDVPVPIASITKVMTLLLTFEALEQGRVTLEDRVPVSEHSYHMGGSQIWLEPGEQFTLDEMLRAICVSSANDAAVAVAEFIGGSEPAFVEQMNAKAAALGLTDTHFVNACGLDAPGHLSTAREVAMLSREILTRYPEVTRYTTIWTDSLRGGATHLINTNKLLRRYDGITGLKTGTTSGAGVCITASARRDGLSLIAVVLGSPSGAERFQAARALLDYGFANFESVPVRLPDTAPALLPVHRGSAEKVELHYALPEHLLLKKGERDGLVVTTSLPGGMQAPVRRGQQAGTVTVYSGGQALGSWPVQAQQDVPRLDLRRAFNRLTKALLTP